MKILIRRSLFTTLTVMFFVECVLAEPTALDECWQEADTRLDLAPCLKSKLDDSNRTMLDATERVRASMRELELMTGRHGYVEAFEVSQKAFLQFRNANCAWRYAQASPGTGAGDFQLSCLVQMTGDRVEELREALERKR